jgi:hypothetical protein
MSLLARNEAPMFAESHALAGNCHAESAMKATGSAGGQYQDNGFVGFIPPAGPGTFTFSPHAYRR